MEFCKKNKYEDLAESLNPNKEIKGFSKYVNDYILRLCDEKREDQLVI